MGVQEIGCNYLEYSPLKTWLWFLLLLKVGQIDTTVFGSNLEIFLLRSLLILQNFLITEFSCKFIDSWEVKIGHFSYSQISLENTILFQKEKNQLTDVCILGSCKYASMYNKEKFSCLSFFFLANPLSDLLKKKKNVDLKHRIGTKILFRDSWIYHLSS